MTVIRPFCGFREGVDAHRAAGEVLCEACRASDARRRALRASKRRSVASEDDWEDVNSVDLAGTFERAQERGWNEF